MLCNIIKIQHSYYKGLHIYAALLFILRCFVFWTSYSAVWLTKTGIHCIASWHAMWACLCRLLRHIGTVDVLKTSL